MKHTLYPQERHRQILAYLEQIGRVSVEDLGRRFNVSRVTIRGDLEILANQNLLVRTHGGAILISRNEFELSYKIRQRIHTTEKERIAIAAAELVHDNDTIVLDASTTALGIAAHLKTRQDLTVFTNSLPVALELLEAPGINVLVPAGFLRKESASLVGMSCLETLRDYNFQKAFCSAKGFTVSAGLTEVSEPEAAIKRDILTKSRDLIAVLDSSKLGLTSFASFASLQRIATFITDRNAPPEIIDAIRAAGVTVILA